MSPKPAKQKVCRCCKTKFAPFSSTSRVCSALCGLTVAREDREKREKVAKAVDRQADKVKKEKLKTRGQWIAIAQTAFNAFIRERDRLVGHACISSGRPLDWSGNNVDAGHYRSRGSAPHLRFDERNCHAQTKQENRYASGNAIGYRTGLIARIGLEAVEALEADQTPRRHSIEDLKAIKADYTAKTRALKKEHL